MPRIPDRSHGSEAPVDWEDISRSVVQQPRLPEDRVSEEEIQLLKALEQARRPERRPLSGFVGCGCLGLVGAVSGIITLLFSALMLVGGSAGTFARQMVEGQVAGAGLSSAEIWGTLIAPSIILVLIGVPPFILGLREYRRIREKMA